MLTITHLLCKKGKLYFVKYWTENSWWDKSFVLWHLIAHIADFQKLQRTYYSALFCTAHNSSTSNASAVQTMYFTYTFVSYARFCWFSKWKKAKAQYSRSLSNLYCLKSVLLYFLCTTQKVVRLSAARPRTVRLIWSI